MKHLYFTTALLTIVTGLSAQSIKLPEGKKFTTVIENTTTTNMSIMGQDLEVLSGNNLTHEYEVKKVSATGYSLLATAKKISGSVSVMGQEQKFDSDDLTSLGTPEMAEMFKIINKQQEIKVENGKLISNIADSNNALALVGINLNNIADMNKLFLSIPVDHIKQGYSWSDSIVTENFKAVNQYLISSTANQQVEIRVSTDSKINATIKQAGMEVKQDMKGFSTATRVYDRSNGLLMSEKLAIEMTGTAEVMGLSAPMTVKTGINTTVKQ